MNIRNVFSIALAACVISAGSDRALAATNEAPVTATEAIVLPYPIPDPLEKVNRGLFAVNEFAMKGVVQPSSKVYRLLVPPPFRIGFSNIGKNLQYPRRVINNLLQERWAGARDETERFLCNSVLGMGGFLDVAREFDVHPSEADFAQTFGKWGWNQNFYLMIPVAGPSSDRDAVGAGVDIASNPLTYFSPYNYIPTGIRYNDLTDSVDGYIRTADSQMDPYALLRDAYGVLRADRPVDWHVEGQQHIPSLETIKTVLFSVRDPKFPGRVHEAKVKIPNTGHELPYNLWLQDRPAPIIYLNPGIGSHRWNGGAVALAEVLYDKGFSVAVISSVFNYEFIGNGLSADLPGYAISDVRDIHAAVTRIDQQILKEHPGTITSRGVMGYSMGGFHTLMLAATARENPAQLQFDRYLAVDVPVRLLHGIEQLDSFYNAALEWPASERTQRIDALLAKAGALARSGMSGTNGLPLSSIESRFVIGLVFRLNLRDVIFYTQLRHNQGVLTQPVDKWKREPAYREIMNYSFTDYLNKFITPYYLKRGIDLRNADTLKPAVNLQAHETALKAMPSVRVVANEDDILLAPEDVQWLEQTFGDRVTLFPHGGHLGNLDETPVQTAIVNAFADLRTAPVRRDVISSAPPKHVLSR